MNTETARTSIELYARRGPALGVWDISGLDAGEVRAPVTIADARGELAAAIRLLDEQGCLVRPDPMQPHLVTFLEGAA